MAINFRTPEYPNMIEKNTKNIAQTAINILYILSLRKELPFDTEKEINVYHTRSASI